ncbi:MAG: methyltransferase domain-containing protein [Pseudomonadota bacterium]|nr:methyltransferase domain-containing protein [Pseudomonadota bacterium]
MNVSTSEAASAAQTKADDRTQFVNHQLSFNGSWYRNLLNSGRDVEAVVNGRKAAYLTRWSEAGRYIGQGGRILDIGGGNLYPELLQYFKAMNWDYWYIDVGQPQVAGSAQTAAAFGFDPAHFSCGLNHELHYPDHHFDAVFSSHCLEHSMDLKLTLTQLNHILRDGGNVVASVPFGWDPLPAHPYFMLENEWLALFEDAGFRIRAYQISGEYAENTQDLMIAAQKCGPVAANFRLDPFDYAKDRFAFHDFRSPEITYRGSQHRLDDRIILQGSDWEIEFPLPPGVREALPVFIRHNWSGVACVESGTQKIYCDLFRMQWTIQPARLKLAAPAQAGQTLRISPAGKNDISLSSQVVFCGYMCR